ncbi:FecCD family ABC transporter permease [Dehalobacterium formicoaceticum]|uniref:Iron ABC transporter permease n=1 Tax=Dehalobacterium formicoaceticum TaxID=51515 RepID=A0ABT1XZN5_9FIRM|nr:iron chelate uptake ABC transporter family permease subunit [Dehalobacterium formicoaceticum]MCR6544077.1 iron ABC transporter permease [Dehalobacterium formicoaceticum]
MNFKEKRKHWKALLISCSIALVLISIYTITIGPAELSFRDAMGIILAKIPFFQRWINLEQYSQVQLTIIWSLRVPRVILAGLVGGALGVVGATFQGFFKNPMADPSVIGVSSGAALGATLAIVTGMGSFLGFLRIPFFSFCGALLTTFLVYTLGRVGNKVVVSTLLLAGVALSSFLQAMISFLMVMNAEKMEKVYFWLLGSFANRNWEHVLIAAPLIIVGVLLLMLFSKELNAMVFGDSTAHHLGIDLEKVKIIILVLASLTAAGAVAVCGIIGFVGLIIPHIVRMLVGPDHRILLPMSFFVGGIFMVLTDTAARTLFAPMEIPIGVITAMFGGPFFIYLLKKKKDSIF